MTEVSKACESSTATLADIFALLVQLRLTMLGDTFDVPSFPDVPLAVGAHAIERFLKDHTDEDVMELDNRLYSSELAYVERTPGYEHLCAEAGLAVLRVRTEVDRLFFSPEDATKNWLKNPAVLTSLLLTPGGAKMMQEAATWLNFEDPTADAVAAVQSSCARLVASREARSASGADPAASAAPGGMSDGRHAARLSLARW